MILVIVMVKLTPDQPVVEGKQSTFTCAGPAHETISYMWKSNDTTIPSEDKRQYSFIPSRTQNGTKLSCTATTEAGVTSEESQVTLQVFCKGLI